MAEESSGGRGLKISSAWFSPQVIIMLIGLALTSFAQWKMSDYRLGKVEDKLEKISGDAGRESLEWARTSERMLARIDRLSDQQRELREDLQLANARIVVLERKDR